jgi:hypothetical protein
LLQGGLSGEKLVLNSYAYGKGSNGGNENVMYSGVGGMSNGNEAAQK